MAVIAPALEQQGLFVSCCPPRDGAGREDTFAVGDTSSHAVRVSLGAARNRAELATALQFLAAAMRSSVASLQIV